jgi:hypothetical protein
MRVYSVSNRETGYSEEFYNLSSAKRAMKAHSARGEGYRVYANGDWAPTGEISLTGDNKHFIANSRQTKRGY